MASFMSEKITKSIYDLYKNRNTENDNEFDFFNVWTHYTGIKVPNVESLEEVLDFIRMVLKSDKNYLKTFLEEEI